MGRLNFFRPLGLAIVSVLPQPAFADIGVPSAARMVCEANVIVVGRVLPGNPPMLVPREVLKGRIAPNKALALADPSKGQFLSFNIDQVSRLAGENPTVALGRLDAQGATLALTWLNFSLWPQGYKHDTFASESLQTTRNFIERLLAYSSIAAREPDGALRQLAADVVGENADSVLAYLEVPAETDFDSATAEQIRAVCAANMRAAKPHAPSVRQFADTAHLFPASLAAPMALNWARQYGGEEEKRLKNAVYSILSARGAKNIAPNSSVEDLGGGYRQIAATLRRADGRRLVKIFDSPHASLREVFGDALLEAILNRIPQTDPKALSARDKKQAWLREIDAE